MDQTKEEGTKRTQSRMGIMRSPIIGGAEKLKAAPLASFMQDMWMWIYMISFVAVALITFFIFIWKYRAGSYEGVQKPGWVPGYIGSSIIIIAVYALYTIGAYRLDRMAQGNGDGPDKRLWIFRSLFFGTIVFQLIIGWIALITKKYQWCFFLSFIPPLILAGHLFFAWIVDKVGFALMLPAFVIQIIQIWIYWKYWQLNK